MSHASEFQSAIQPLLRRIGIQPPDSSDGIVYAFDVNDGIKIALAGNQPGFLIMTAEVGAPVDLHNSEQLAQLLSCNRFTTEHPPLIGTVDPQGSFMLWARQALHELDEASLMNLLDRTLAAAASVRSWLLNTPARGDSSGLAGSMLA